MKRRENSRSRSKKLDNSSKKPVHLAAKPTKRLILLGSIVCVVIVGALATAAFFLQAKWARQADAEAQVPVGVRTQPTHEPALKPEPASVLPEPMAVPAEPLALPPEPAIAVYRPMIQTPPFVYSPPATVDATKKEELETVRRLVKNFPNQPGPIGIMASICEKRGNTEEAVEYWEKCLQLDPDSSDAYFHLGRLAMRRGEYGEAVAMWRKTLEIEPTRPDVYRRLAAALTASGKPAEAIEALEKDIEITPGALDSHYLLGQAYSQLKDYRHAKEHYQAVVEVDPNHINAHYGLATVCVRVGEMDEAKQHRQKFKALQEQDLKDQKDRHIAFDDLRYARQTTSETYTKAGLQYARHANAPKAEEIWLKAAVLDSHNAACRVYLTELYRSDHRDRQALSMYEQLRRIEPDNALVCMNMSVVQIGLEQFDAAESSLRKVIELASQRSTGYDSLAQLYMHLDKKLPEAKTLAQKAVQLEPIAQNYVTLSQASEKTGDRANALSALQRAVELDPANERYRQMLQSLGATDE